MSIHLYVLAAESEVTILDQWYYIIIQFALFDVACWFVSLTRCSIQQCIAF